MLVCRSQDGGRAWTFEGGSVGSSWTRERVHAAAHRRQQALVQVGQHGVQHEHDGTTAGSCSVVSVVRWCKRVVQEVRR